MKNALRVVLLGAFARKFLAAPGEARVIASFRRCLYLENARGRVACAGEASIGPGPLNALCERAGDADFRETAPGSRAIIGDGLIRLETGADIDASRAEAWRPPPLPGGWSPARLGRSLALLAEWTGEGGRREGLAPLVPRIAGGAEASGGGALAEMARRGVDELEAWLSDALSGERTPAYSLAGGSLIGLGPGLTPSGDDFWCGAMLALRALGRLDVLAKISAPLLGAAKARTNAISRAHLACAAAGQGAEALREAISAMGMADAARLRSALRALEDVGSSSGLDALAGAACVFARAAAREARPVRA